MPSRGHQEAFEGGNLLDVTVRLGSHLKRRQQSGQHPIVAERHGEVVQRGGGALAEVPLGDPVGVAAVVVVVVVVEAAATFESVSIHFVAFFIVASLRLGSIPPKRFQFLRVLDDFLVFRT